jgi:hypothetical protein
MSFGELLELGQGSEKVGRAWVDRDMVNLAAVAIPVLLLPDPVMRAAEHVRDDAGRVERQFEEVDGERCEHLGVVLVAGVRSYAGPHPWRQNFVPAQNRQLP